MTTTPDPIAAIERALEGVTNRATWSVEGYDDDTGQADVVGGGFYIAGVIANQPDQEETAKFIAACNPVAITALLSLARQSAEKDAEIARLREALKPFSEVAGELFAQNYNDQDIVLAVKGKSGKGAEIHYSLAFKAFRRARTLIQGDKP